MAHAITARSRRRIHAFKRGAHLHNASAPQPCRAMPPRASAAEKGKAPAKRGAKRGAEEEMTLADLLARCTRADLEALLLEHADDLPDLQGAVEAKLKPEQVRCARAQQRTRVPSCEVLQGGARSRPAAAQDGSGA